MKANPHQARAKNSPRPQSKQSRVRTPARTAETPKPKLRHVFGSGREDEDLLVSESGPEQFYLQHPPEDSPPRPVSRAEAVAWFKDSFVPKELKADFAPSVVPVQMSRATVGEIHNENGRLSCAVMMLCRDMANELAARSQAVHEAVKAFRAGKEGAL